MIYIHEWFRPWRGEDRYSLSTLEDADWIYPAEALEMLAASKAVTPMPHREFLAWHAQHGSLATVAQEIHEQQGEESVLYPRIPIVEEWSQLDWQSPNATLWLNATMQASRADSSGVFVKRTYLEIVFERLTVFQFSMAYSPDDPPEEANADAEVVEVQPSAEQPNIWTEDTMRAAIRSCPIGNRERAWREVFKPRQGEHGWKNRGFLDFWSEARGTKGSVGAPRK